MCALCRFYFLAIHFYSVFLAIGCWYCRSWLWRFFLWGAQTLCMRERYMNEATSVLLYVHFEWCVICTDVDDWVCEFYLCISIFFCTIYNNVYFLVVMFRYTYIIHTCATLLCSTLKFYDCYYSYDQLTAFRIQHSILLWWWRQRAEKKTVTTYFFSLAWRRHCAVLMIIMMIVPWRWWL